HNVIDQSPHFAQELLAQVLQFIVVLIKAVVQKDQLHESLGDVVHPVEAVQAVEHAAEETLLLLISELYVIDPFFIQDQPPQEVFVAGRDAAQFLIRLHVLDVSLHQRGELVHVLHHLGFLIEDLVCIGINLRLLLLIFLQIGLLGIRKRGTSQSQNQEKDGKFSNETHNSSRVRTLFSQLKIDVYQDRKSTRLNS